MNSIYSKPFSIDRIKDTYEKSKYGRGYLFVIEGILNANEKNLLKNFIRMSNIKTLTGVVEEREKSIVESCLKYLDYPYCVLFIHFGEIYLVAQSMLQNNTGVWTQDLCTIVHKFYLYYFNFQSNYHTASNILQDLYDKGELTLIKFSVEEKEPNIFGPPI